MNTKELIKKEIERKNAVAMTVCGTIGAGVGLYMAAGATTVVLGATAAPGALKTATVMINGQAMVYSLVKASLLTKICVGLLWTVAIGVTAYMIYDVFTNEDN